MKLMPLLMIVAFVLAGCCSTQYDLQHSPTSDLQIRRYELKHCLSMARMNWRNLPRQADAYDDVTADLEEKAAIEREISRRDVTDYHWPPSVADRYGRDRCHCQCWIVTL